MTAITEAGTTTITYEQPLNETMRLCLRVEHLFSNLKEHAHASTITDRQLALQAIAKLINVIDRPDIKSKLTQCLTQQHTALEQMTRSPQVDLGKLQPLLNDAQHFSTLLHKTHQRIGDTLKSNAFLNHVRAHLNNPAGAAHFSSPQYALWLHSPQQQCANNIQQWLAEMGPLNSIVQLILHITRLSASTQTLVAQDGFYHQPLDASQPASLLRLSLPVRLHIYPEISVGKHHLSIRFMQPDNQSSGHAHQLTETMQFTLSCCKL